jgi:hypothetical protein
MRKAEADQRKLDLAAFNDADEGIRQGLEDLKKGKVRPAEDVLAEFEKRHGITKSMLRTHSTRKCPPRKILS